MTNKTISVFDFTDYKTYLKKVISKSPLKGCQSLMAKACKCQKSYFSQMLNSHTHLTPEHAVELFSFLELNDFEEQYFMELLNYARAGSLTLKVRIKKNLDKIKDDSINLTKKYEQYSFTNELKEKYYSSWIYCAIHVIVSIPTYQSTKTISKRLNLEEVVVENILKDLKKMNLVDKVDNKWNTKSDHIHIGKDSPLLTNHHTNWRQRAVFPDSISQKNNINYTSVFSVSKSDMEKLRNMITQFIDETRALISSSREEDIACFNIDFFKA